MGNNGAYVAGTAYGKTYGKCYVYFAVNQIATGVAAGWYYAEASSTTAFTVYNNNPAATGMPTAPTSKTAFVTTGPGAITGDTTEQGLLVPIAANQPGLSGWWRLRARFRNNTTGTGKTHRIRYSGIAGTQLVGIAAAAAGDSYLDAMVNQEGVANVQEALGTITGASGLGTGTFTTLGIDTTASTTAAATTQIATATDWAVMEWAVFEMMTDGT